MHKDTLLTNLPKIARKDLLTINMSESIGNSLDTTQTRINEYPNQLDVDKATWGLEIYEKDLGLSADNKTITERRSNIKARLRGSGHASLEQIKSIIADSYPDGEVNVTYNGQIKVEFVSIRGVPTNMDDLKSIISDIVPAHIRVEYIFRYLLFDELDTYDITFDELDALGMTFDEFAAWNGT
ncbi:putative phage tail protein [Paenibacillus thailandensis]|uniref:Phage tail protein n=1 Tax=Paenibacillus thailandensis TaxID=393250 RepID=A0ABW5R2Y8_9BACL